MSNESNLNTLTPVINKLVHGGEQVPAIPVKRLAEDNLPALTSVDAYGEFYDWCVEQGVPAESVGTLAVQAFEQQEQLIDLRTVEARSIAQYPVDRQLGIVAVATV